MTHLRAVAPGEQPPARKQYKTIAAALEGSGTDVLVAMRRQLAKKLDDGDIASNAIASAYKELRELDRLIRLAESVDEEAPTSIGHDDSFNASAI